jgi:hypothetical protein
MMKKCTICKKEKSLTEFNKNKCRKDGLNNLCKECSRKRSRKYYKDNHEKHIIEVGKNKEKYINRNRQRIIEYFINHHCVDCGEKDIRVLEFDHLRDKENTISYMIQYPMSWEKIEKEIKKCEVRCSNCHKIKTAKEINSYRQKYIEENMGS